MSTRNYAVIVYTNDTISEDERVKAQQQIKSDIDAGLPVILPAGWTMFITALPQGKSEVSKQYLYYDTTTGELHFTNNLADAYGDGRMKLNGLDPTRYVGHSVKRSDGSFLTFKLGKEFRR